VTTADIVFFVRQPFTSRHRKLGKGTRLTGLRLKAKVTCNHSAEEAMAGSGKKSSRDKVRRHRERLRRQGLRPIQIWVPDVRAPGFRAEAHRQSVAVAESPHAMDDQAFIDAVSTRDGEAVSDPDDA